MRVHFVVHHARDRAAGASGATQSLGAALAALGCEVSYFHFDEAFGAEGGDLSRMLRFPWRVASHLAREAGQFDVVDATTGDAWLWASRRGATACALVTRSHGLEHVADADLRARAARGEARISAKYPLYHGGFRLWEVGRSLRAAEAQVFLNEADRSFAIDRLGVPASSSVVIPNGVADRLLDARHELTDDVDMVGVAPIALAFIGSWIPRKGIAAIALAADLLVAQGVPFSLRLLGSGFSQGSVLRDFSEQSRPFVTVSPKFGPDELPGLLHGAEVLVHPSWTEGFSLALVEGMALGLAPVATRSGGAPGVVADGVTGLLLEDGSGECLASAVGRLARDRVLLAGLRRAARVRMQELRWSHVASRTLAVYRGAMERRLSNLGRM